MTNCEHLIENALTAMTAARNVGKDTYIALQCEMCVSPNTDMLRQVNITKDELWEIAQYIMYTWTDGYYCPNCGQAIDWVDRSDEE